MTFAELQAAEIAAWKEYQEAENSLKPLRDKWLVAATARAEAQHKILQSAANTVIEKNETSTL